jgi:adenylate cyclase
MPRVFIAASIAAVAGAVVAVLHLLGALPRLELLLHDARLASGLGRKPPRADIVIAWVDQDAIDHVRREAGTYFPWPRSVWQEVLGYLREGGAKAVVFDVLFTEPGVVAADDATFGAALQETTGDVLGFKFVGYREGGFDAAETARMTERGLELPGRLALPAERGVTLPIPELEVPADGLGFVNVRPDADRVHRGYDLLRAWRGRAYPSLALAAALAANPADAVSVAGGTLRAAGLAVPVDRHARMQLAFRGGPLTFPHVQVVNILESIVRRADGQPPIYPPETFAGKIVLVGINAEGYADVVPTPLSKDFPGVELHATALDNLLQGDALRVAEVGGWLAAAGTLAGTAVVFALPGTLWPALALLLVLLATTAAAFAAFAAGVLLPVAPPLLGAALAGAGSFVWRLGFEGRKRREMRRAFTSYMAPEVVHQVLADPDRVQLGGEVRQVTLLFTDLAGFTGLAEHVRPHELVAFLNDYFTRMCDCVLAQRGVIDKFIGDSIMAMFGAPVPQPDQAERAVLAALGMFDAMHGLGAELEHRGWPPVGTRIGIHCGEAVVGNMGSNKRFDYTAVGDTVNLASRLEGANKAFGTRCLVSEPVWAAVAERVLGREVGLVRVKGRDEPIRVFEPIALGARAGGPAHEAAGAHARALAALRAGAAADAAAMFAALAAAHPDDVLWRTYRDRCADPTWDGVFTLETK